MEPDVKDNRNVKLSCRNVWKVYGSQPEQFFNSLNGSVDDANSHAEKIRNDGHIVANADVSFDVHAGEIFVIMGLSGSGKSSLAFDTPAISIEQKSTSHNPRSTLSLIHI